MNLIEDRFKVVAVLLFVLSLTILSDWLDHNHLKVSSTEDYTVIESPLMDKIDNHLYPSESIGENSVLKNEKFSLIVAPEKSYTQNDLDFLAQNLYFEERSTRATDLEIAQIGYVVLNRVKSKHFKNTIHDVIWFSAWSRKYQKRVAHFSWTLDGESDLMHNTKAKERSFRIAKAVLEGTTPNMIGDADHYLNKEISSVTWWETMTFRGKFNNHWFYKR